MPSHLGQSPAHVGEGFELVKEINEAGIIVLVSVLIKPTKQGIYMATSTYPISQSKVENRLATGHLIHV